MTDSLNRKYLTIFELYYKERRSPWCVIDALETNKAKFYRLRNSFIDLAGQYLGY